MKRDLWLFESKAIEKGFSYIAGIDEAGRGPLAGPVVSAAVLLPTSFHDPDITDSKKLSPKKRSYLYEKLYDQAVSIGIGIIDNIEIERINILNASLLSMAISVKNLSPQPDYLLIDGKFRIPTDLPQEPIIRGDALSISIAAASIVAKVSRDRLMERYDLDYPQFGFSKHKGYPTKAHKEAIRTFGCCPIHRRTFKGVKEYRTLTC
ncbi:MAG: ribonuclease HII [Deltaproteobacteria bacterium]|nr:ribonuclease HII [Deltaproteobacteria bacterium]